MWCISTTSLMSASFRMNIHDRKQSAHTHTHKGLQADDRSKAVYRREEKKVCFQKSNNKQAAVHIAIIIHGKKSYRRLADDRYTTDDNDGLTANKR